MWETAMTTTLNCPHCGQLLSIPAEPGQQVRCGGCNAVFTMPPPVSATASGEAPTLDYAQPTRLRTGMAIAALVFGVAGILFCPVFAVIGLILGIVALVRVNKRPDEYGGKGLAIAGICCGGFGLLVMPFITAMMLSILLPSLSRARELAKRAVCSANLRGIGQGLDIYANGNEEWFPQDLQALIDAGFSTPAEFQCPSEANASLAKFDYIYVPGLDARAPVDWILVYEDPANHNGEGANVLYIDGRVQFLKEPNFTAELDRVRQEIEASEYGGRSWYREHPLEVPETAE
jgi:prepilin-type processing-associated H-X9-DG protein